MMAGIKANRGKCACGETKEEGELRVETEERKPTVQSEQKPMFEIKSNLP